MMAGPSREQPPVKVALCIPTLNPGPWVERLTSAVGSQTLRPDPFLVIDSSSADGSLDRFRAAGARVIRIPRDRFDHGGTRNLALDETDADVVIYLTQDAIPTHDTTFAALVDGLLEDARTGLAYGRQLARPDDPPHVRAHRTFNYPAEPSRRTADDVARLGVRAAFSSNSFAAYRRAAIEDIGRFPAPIIGSEDRWAAARLLQRGWHVAYVPAASVEHSHEYGLIDTFRRYFDIGVFHVSQPWFEEWLGRPEGEGIELVRSQLSALRTGKAGLAPVGQIVRGAVSWLGFRSGRAHARIPRSVCRRCSMNRAYWLRPSS
jgi:rhamnosyltransferase